MRRILQEQPILACGQALLRLAQLRCRGHAKPCNRPRGARRKTAGEAMAGRITELVNTVLRAEEGANALSSAQVLDLIDLGASPGGSDVRPVQRPAFH